MVPTEPPTDGAAPKAGPRDRACGPHPRASERIPHSSTTSPVENWVTCAPNSSRSRANPLSPVQWPVRTWATPVSQKAAGQGPDLLVRGGVEVEAPDDGLDGPAGESGLDLPDDGVRPGVAAAAQEDQPRGVSSTKVCSWEKSSGTHCPARRQNIPAAAPAGPGQGLCGEQMHPRQGREGPGDVPKPGANRSSNPRFGPSYRHRPEAWSKQTSLQLPWR